MIARIWHGYTTFENADVYEKLLKTEVFKGIEAKKIPGYQGIQLLRRELEQEVEFTTIMWFDKLSSVRQFVGEDYEKAYVPPKAQQVLKRYDRTSIHCELRHSLIYDQT